LAVANLAQALAALPAEMLAHALGAVDRWLDTRFVASSLVTVTLIDLFDRLLRDEQWQIALSLFAVLVKLKAVETA
jgi:hypothetical protein